LYEDKPPDLVLVELNGQAAIPAWLEQVIERLPRSKVFVCSQSRDPDFLIQVMKLRTGGFIPLPLHQEDLQSAILQIKAARAKKAKGSPRAKSWPSPAPRAGWAPRLWPLIWRWPWRNFSRGAWSWWI
jgi:DNA-binding NarL/FixJ family response regulator